MKPFSKIAVLATIAAVLVATGTPAGAAVDYDAGVTRTIEAGFTSLPNGHAVTITATATEGAGGAGTTPGTDSSAAACVTVTKDNGSPRTMCGPATVSVDPLLRTATATGVIGGIRFDLDFVAHGAPAPSTSSGLPTDTTATAGFSQAGSATVALLADIFGDAETQGSSWYAETREKVQSSARAQ